MGAIIKEEEEEYIVLSNMNKSVYSRKPEIFKKKKKKLFNLLMTFSKVFNFVIMHVVFIALFHFWIFVIFIVGVQSLKY
jgi:hypothetical protein